MSGNEAKRPMPRSLDGNLVPAFQRKDVRKELPRVPIAVVRWAAYRSNRRCSDRTGVYALTLWPVHVHHHQNNRKQPEILGRLRRNSSPKPIVIFH